MFCAGLALALVLLSDAVVRQQGLEKAGRRALGERAALLVSIQGTALSVPMWNLDKDQVRAALDALAADPDFVSASITGPDGAILERRPPRRGREAAEAPGSRIEVAREIRYDDHGELRSLGTLHLSLATDRLRAAMRADLREGAASLALLLAALMLILFGALHQFTRPLTLLANALTRLADGDRETPIPASDRKDEVGAVARGLEVFRDTAFRLMKTEGTFKVLVDTAPLGIYGADERGRLYSANAALLRITGYPDMAALVAALAISDGTGCYVSGERQRELYGMMRNQGGFAGEVSEIRRADGTTAWVSQTARAVLDEAGNHLGFTGTVEDVTDLRRSQDEERLRVRAAIESASDAILIVDTDGGVLFANPAFESCFGYAGDGLTRLGGLSAVLTDPAASAALDQALREGGAWQGEADVLAGDGRIVPLLIRVSAIRDGQGASFGSVAICSDLSDRRLAEARIQHMALYDWLTGLPNRVLFRERLHAALAQAPPHGVGFAVLCLDLDRFKAVNDLLGHAVGDRLLQMVSSRLHGVVREGDTVARVGGDEFVIIQLGISHADQAAMLAERLISELAQPFDLDGREAQIGASVGIALAPLHGNDPDRLLGYADVALYDAKMQGRRQVRIFTPDMDRKLRNRTELERDLRRTVAEQRLHLNFQPQFLLPNETLVGAEALLRWNDPQRGFVPPAEFIPIAEECGLINMIGQWVLHTACLEAASWPGALRMAVNVSPAQFHTGNLIAVTQRVLHDTGIDPDRLELEITEGVLLLDTEATRATLVGLKSLGVRITLDDFGTGYSSLSYLRRMPFDKIKIDRSFVAAMGHDPAATALVRSIIGLAKGLGLEINAEGVETEAQAKLLRDEGCEEVQGFYYGRPLPAREFAKLLAPRLISPAAARYG
jgi:diguanylate cyclase (GGDEF)-like protein/PAS domain S-box-containing protein